MHRVIRQPDGDSPGLTPLIGQYSRPDELWVCWDRNVPQLVSTASTNLTDATRYCVRGDTLELAAKLTYYAARALSVLRTATPPIIPPP